MFCDATQFLSFPLCGNHAKPHRVRGLRNHYHIKLDTNLGYGTCVISQISCVFNSCTSMLYKLWSPGVAPSHQTRCRHVQYCTYCLVLGCFIKWNILIISNKNTTSEDLDQIYQFVLDGISHNISSQVQYSKYISVNTTYPTILGYYVVKYV